MGRPSNLLGSVEQFSEKLLGKLEEGVSIEELKRYFIKQVVEVSRGRCGDLGGINDWLGEVRKALRFLGFSVIDVEAELSGVGLVGSSDGLIHGVLEVGLSWDYVRDVPYFPASTVKGGFRSVLLGRCARVEGVEGRLKCVELVLKLLGWVRAPSRAEVRELCELLGIKYGGGEGRSSLENIVRRGYGISHVVFTDSYPIRCPESKGLLRPWIITPHYAREVKYEYDVRPTPIPHLVISEGTTFRFIVGIDAEGLVLAKELHKVLGDSSVKGSRVSGLVLIASALLSILESGLGARTAKGYGSFRVSRIIYELGDMG